MYGATFILVLFSIVSCEDSFVEELRLQPLDNKLVHARFIFSTTTSPGATRTGHYHLFPKSLGEILEKYHIQELELSLTQGKWRYSQWGIPSEGSANPSGASILALFDSNISADSVDKQWKGLVNSLSGMICASLNFADNTVTTSPQYTFTPRGAVNANTKFHNAYLRYANLPQENVCTENLTPWKKLLPSNGKAGLSTLLHSKPLFDSHYHSMSIVVRPQCKTEDCTSIDLKLTLGLSVVLSHSERNDFSISSLFGHSVGRKCQIAARSDVIVKFPSEGKLFLTLDPPADNAKDINGFTLASYEVSRDFNLKAGYRQKPSYSMQDPPVIHSLRYLSGYGQEYGSIVCEIANNIEENIQIVYTEYIPWFLRVYLHTLSIESGGNTVTPAKIKYSPGLERKKPYMFELLLTLPSNSTTVIRFDVDKLFLKWTEYPPDANLGFHIPSAIITAVIPDAPEDAAIEMMKEGYGVVRIYTEKLVVLLPTPDFSMPYNVICLACTVVALAFGSIHNLTTKTLVRQTEKKPSMLKRVVINLKKMLGMKVEEVSISPSGEENQAGVVEGDQMETEESAGEEEAGVTKEPK